MDRQNNNNTKYLPGSSGVKNTAWRTMTKKLINEYIGAAVTPNTLEERKEGRKNIWWGGKKNLDPLHSLTSLHSSLERIFSYSLEKSRFSPSVVSSRVRLSFLSTVLYFEGVRLSLSAQTHISPSKSHTIGYIQTGENAFQWRFTLKGNYYFLVSYSTLRFTFFLWKRYSSITLSSTPLFFG